MALEAASFVYTGRCRSPLSRSESGRSSSPSCCQRRTLSHHRAPRGRQTSSTQDFHREVSINFPVSASCCSVAAGSRGTIQEIASTSSLVRPLRPLVLRFSSGERQLTQCSILDQMFSAKDCMTRSCPPREAMRTSLLACCQCNSSNQRHSIDTPCNSMRLVLGGWA